MGMSDLYGPAEDAESVATIRAALDAGVTLLDTGDYSWLGFDGRPAAVKTFVAYSLRRLGTDYVDIYRPGPLALTAYT